MRLKSRPVTPVSYTHLLVDSYEMADGSKFSWDNPQQAAYPYQNRDPRFYACLLYTS